ncbi:hypothetical protein vseg_003802 [Gypsophila vaccaria]
MLNFFTPFLHFLPLLLCYTLSYSAAIVDGLNRRDFPPTFVFGAGTSAYQVEGAAFEDGKTASIADSYGHSGVFPDNGDVACDEYHKYKDDVRLMVETGLEAYRFSISWSRLLPSGREPVNPKGLAYYNNLIDELVKHGIQPHVTLLHQDVPLAIEDEYGGFTDPRIVDDFAAYTNVCFREFGDRVRHWTTINEANLFAYTTYQMWRSPHRIGCSPPADCTNGNIIAKAYDPFLIAHHALLAHASSARLYKAKYQAKQHGFIGFSLYALYFTPFSNSTEDVTATERSYDFFIDWLMHPLMYGDYPEKVKKAMGVDLPVFSKSDSNLVKGTFDFIGLNYYSSILVKDDPSTLKLNKSFLDYMKVLWIYINGSNPLTGDPFVNTPWGLKGVLEHFKHVYNNPPIFIHENGQLTNYTTSLDDPTRVEFIRDHIGSLLDAIRNGSNAKGYFAWSFIDVFEFLYGYKKTFGLYYVDFNDPNLPRYPKLSQKWYSNFLRGRSTTLVAEI